MCMNKEGPGVLPNRTVGRYLLIQTGEENKSTKLKNETIYGEERVTFRGIKIVYFKYKVFINYTDSSC